MSPRGRTDEEPTTTWKEFDMTKSTYVPSKWRNEITVPTTDPLRGISSAALTYAAGVLVRELSTIPGTDSVKGYPLYDDLARLVRVLKDLAR